MLPATLPPALLSDPLAASAAVPNGPPADAESAAFRAMFAARKSVFVDLLGWDLPVLDGQYELDQFDDEHAHYLILMGKDGRHRASARLLPTERPHLLGDLYAVLCEGAVPAGPHVREITRFCLDRAQSAAERLVARNELITALTDHALAEGITDYTGVAERGWFEQIAAFGWDCRALGQGVVEAGRELVGLHIRIDADTVAALTDGGVYIPNALFRGAEPVL